MTLWPRKIKRRWSQVFLTFFVGRSSTALGHSCERTPLHLGHLSAFEEHYYFPSHSSISISDNPCCRNFSRIRAKCWLYSESCWDGVIDGICYTNDHNTTRFLFYNYSSWTKIEKKDGVSKRIMRKSLTTSLYSYLCYLSIQRSDAKSLAGHRGSSLYRWVAGRWCTLRALPDADG